MKSNRFLSFNKFITMAKIAKIKNLSNLKLKILISSSNIPLKKEIISCIDIRYFNRQGRDHLEKYLNAQTTKEVLF